MLIEFSTRSPSGPLAGNMVNIMVINLVSLHMRKTFWVLWVNIHVGNNLFGGIFLWGEADTISRLVTRTTSPLSKYAFRYNLFHYKFWGGGSPSSPPPAYPTVFSILWRIVLASATLSFTLDLHKFHVHLLPLVGEWAADR